MSDAVKQIIETMEKQINGLLMALVMLRRERFLTSEEKEKFPLEIQSIERAIRALKGRQ